MFLLVVVGWVFFRSTDFSMAASLLQRMFAPTNGALPAGIALVAPALAIAAWWGMVGPNPFEMDHNWSWRRRVALTAALGASLAIIVGTRVTPFLYFQF
jgi:hypothetical protein